MQPINDKIGLKSCHLHISIFSSKWFTEQTKHKEKLKKTETFNCISYVFYFLNIHVFYPYFYILVAN